MIGPPTDPREIPCPAGLADVPEAWAFSLLLGLGLLLFAGRLRRAPEAARALLGMLGVVALLTAPAAGLVETCWIGAYPTIDKEGSLLFYLDGVHVRSLLHPLTPDAGLRLIGVHQGHLWAMALADLVFSPMGAYNVWGLLHLGLGWWAAWLLARAVCGDSRAAAVAAFSFGMGLHTLRELQWYTIEKGAVYWLGLYCWAGLEAARRGGRWLGAAAGLFALMTWNNLYLGLVGGALAVLLAVGTGVSRNSTDIADVAAIRRRSMLLVGASLLAALPLLVWQAVVMANSEPLATPEQFLWQRAALDGITLWPPAWNRLPAWRALDPVVVIGSCIMALHIRNRWIWLTLGAVGLLTLLAVGPVLWGEVHNPLYLLLVRVLPGFWRVAKPEVFFVGAWLLLITLAARALAGRSNRALVGAALLSLVYWLAAVRTSEAYPRFSAPVASQLRRP